MKYLIPIFWTKEHLVALALAFSFNIPDIKFLGMAYVFTVVVGAVFRTISTEREEYGTNNVFNPSVVNRITHLCSSFNAERDRQTVINFYNSTNH